ncbi:carbon-nitrogen hydrolase family protein [Kribbella sp. VKM Ac-2566]|uniref:carbon-nitrogen hydrolase family protein n=1 Tax=Kribbella sp. VKM Ac-2566 TaxID=2512218 RepID=UPI001063A5E8|nr:carbon-nitrogen hydrolase family protein [Kribbella sp. VKM Ac-2566]TDX08297.1 putative amidohydrolase [Kribbella sp. VKM Ac-2566]
MSRTLRIGIAQIPLVVGKKSENIRTILDAVDAAASEHCDIVLMPECSLSGWLSQNAATDAESVPGPSTSLIGDRCRQHDLAVVLGMEERLDRKVYNSAVFLDRRGVVRNVHRKINELEIGRALYSVGDRLSVIEFEGWLVGLDICADSWTAPIVDTLYLMGANVILSPCAWAIDPGGEDTNTAWIGENYRAHTVDKDLYILAANSVGELPTPHPWAGRILHGDSLAYGPGGHRIAHAPRSRPAILTVDLAI